MYLLGLHHTRFDAVGWSWKMRTRQFTNLLVQLLIFLIDLFVGTYRLSSHARLEAFVIQTKLMRSVGPGKCLIVY